HAELLALDDSLCDHAESGILRKEYHSFEKTRLPITGAQPLYEAAIDLDAVERQTVQVGYGGEPAPEVIKDQAYAQRFQLVKCRRRGIGALHDCALGDLQSQPGRGELR